MLSTHAHSHRNFYNSKIPNDSHNCQTIKEQALHWYNTWAAFQNVRPDKTYAQALLKNSGKKVIIRDATNVSPTSATKVHDLKVRPCVLHANVHPSCANSVKSYQANTGKQQRMVPNNQNVHIPLHNRFQVLTNSDAESEASVPIDITQHDSNVKYTENSMVVGGDKHLEKHSQECKHPSVLGVSQPFWAIQQNYSFSGNKNKTGSFGMGNIRTKTCLDDSLSHDSSDSVCPGNISGNIVPCVNNFFKDTIVAVSSQDVGIKTQPQLAD